MDKNLEGKATNQDVAQEIGEKTEQAFVLYCTEKKKDDGGKPLGYAYNRFAVATEEESIKKLLGEGIDLRQNCLSGIFEVHFVNATISYETGSKEKKLFSVTELLESYSLDKFLSLTESEIQKIKETYK